MALLPQKYSCAGGKGRDEAGVGKELENKRSRVIIIIGRISQMVTKLEGVDWWAYGITLVVPSSETSAAASIVGEVLIPPPMRT